jgi:hypothetical protein
VKREAADSLEKLVPSAKRHRRSYFLPRTTEQVSVSFKAGNLCYQLVSFSTWRSQTLIPLKHSTIKQITISPDDLWGQSGSEPRSDVMRTLISRRYWEPVGCFEAAKCELRRGQEDRDHVTPRCV